MIPLEVRNELGVEVVCRLPRIIVLLIVVSFPLDVVLLLPFPRTLDFMIFSTTYSPSAPSSSISSTWLSAEVPPLSACSLSACSLSACSLSVAISEALSSLPGEDIWRGQRHRGQNLERAFGDSSWMGVNAAASHSRRHPKHIHLSTQPAVHNVLWFGVGEKWGGFF